MPLILWNEPYAFLINSKEQFQGWERLGNLSINELPVYVQKHTANHQAFAEVLIEGQYAGSKAAKLVQETFHTYQAENYPRKFADAKKPIKQQMLTKVFMLRCVQHGNLKCRY